MSQIDNLFDSGKGKLGNLVFFKRYGKTYVRTKPARYSDRKSPAQLAQRQRMLAVNSFLNQFSGLIRITFATEATGRSALQAAQSFNMRHAHAGEYPNIQIDLDKVLLSTGNLPLPVDVWVSAHPDGWLIEWQNAKETIGERQSDTLVVMGYSESAKTADYKFTEVCRKEGRYVWKPALPLQANELPVIWIAFRNREQTEMSKNCKIAQLNH